METDYTANIILCLFIVLLQNHLILELQQYYLDLSFLFQFLLIFSVLRTLIFILFRIQYSLVEVVVARYCLIFILFIKIFGSLSLLLIQIFFIFIFDQYMTENIQIALVLLVHTFDFILKFIYIHTDWFWNRLNRCIFYGNQSRFIHNRIHFLFGEFILVKLLIFFFFDLFLERQKADSILYNFLLKLSLIISFLKYIQLITRYSKPSSEKRNVPFTQVLMFIFFDSDYSIKKLLFIILILQSINMLIK